MARLASILVIAVAPLVACGGGKKPAPKKPKVEEVAKPPPPKPETEEDRVAKRRTAAHELVPVGTTCLPPSFKQEGAPRLELGANGADALICAMDVDRSRLLGPIACWKIALAEGGLVYDEPRPLPGHSLMVKLDDRCARGMCLPDDAALPDDKIVYLSWNNDSSKVVVLAGESAHIFDAATKAHEKSFSLRGENGVSNTPSGIHWVGDGIFVEGHDAGPASYVFVFKPDGTAVGPMMGLGRKPQMLSTFGGSFVVLSAEKVGVAEKGFTSLTSYEVANGKRAKAVRRVSNGPCKSKEVEAFWTESGEVGAKCKAHLEKTFGHLIGADVVAGRTNLLALLRGPRLGELAVLDARNLKESKTFSLPWCETGGDAAADAGADGN